MKRDMKIESKLLVSLTLISLILILVVVSVSRHYYIMNHDSEIQSKINSKINDIYSSINRISNKALYAASLCSSMDFVHEAYAMVEETGDLEESSKIIGPHWDYVNRTFQSNMAITPKIHFTLDPATSFIRCWTQKKGDDLSTFRSTILEIDKTHEPLDVALKAYHSRLNPKVLVEFLEKLKQYPNAREEIVRFVVHQDLI